MADELTTELSKVPGLSLASRSAAFRFRGPDVDVKAVGRELDVGAVLEGTVRRAGNRMRLTAQLTNASNGKLLWTDSYEQQVEDVFAVQDSITQSIVAALKVKLGGEAAPLRTASTSQGTRNLDAYDLYLRGRYLWARRGEESIRKSIGLFEQAIEADPQFARAHAGLAMAASVLPMYAQMRSDSITPIGLAAGRRAITLDPNLSDAHLGLANVLIYQLKWKEAEDHFKQALALDPANATAHQWYGDYLYVTGRVGDAIPRLRRAVELDPSSPVMQNDLGFALYIAGQFREAEAATRRSIELDPGFPFAYPTLGGALTGQGKLDSALVFLSSQGTENPFAEQILAYRLLNRPVEARAAFEKLRSVTSQLKDGKEYGLGLAHGAIGNVDSALYWLNRAVDVKDGALFSGSISCHPAFDVLQSDVRYDAVLKRMGAVRCRRKLTPASP